MMLFGLPTKLIFGLDERSSLKSLNGWLQFLRLFQFCASVSFLGVILQSVFGLPNGYHAASRMTPVYALAIVASIYPALIWVVLLCVTKFDSKLQSYRISRASDSLVGAPCLIALAVLMGDAGLPSSCAALFEFDVKAYHPTGNRTTTFPADCNTAFRTNDCGTGTAQVKALKHDCQGAQAGFGLVIVTIVVVYFMVAIANLYVYKAVKDATTLPSYNLSMSQQQLILGASTTEIQAGITLPSGAHIRPTRAGEEPPPPYTATAPTPPTIARTETTQSTTLSTMLRPPPTTEDRPATNESATSISNTTASATDTTPPTAPTAAPP